MALKAQSRTRLPTGVEYGQYIFIYNQIHTNQIIYSLTRRMQENEALKQLTFLGKRTKPKQIRPDLWKPFATVQFPSGSQGLAAFKQLREFKKRHEHEWRPRSLEKQRKILYGIDGWEEDSRSNPLRLQYARAVMDQKANAVADLAFVLQLQRNAAVKSSKFQERNLKEDKNVLQKARKRLKTVLELRKEAKTKIMTANSERARREYKSLKTEKLRLQRRIEAQEAAMQGLRANSQEPHSTPQGLLRKKNLPTNERLISMRKMKIEWDNIEDKRFAAKWPSEVFHAGMASENPNFRVPPTKMYGPSAPTDVQIRSQYAKKRAKRRRQRYQTQGRQTTITQPKQHPPTLFQKFVKRVSEGSSPTNK